METAAYSLGLGCVILGSLLNDVPGLIEALHLPQYTYPVLGLAIGKPDQAPALKPRMPRELQFFDDVYPSDADAIESIKERIGAFDVSVHEYTICATPIVPLTHSAIRSPRLQPSAWTPRIR